VWPQCLLVISCCVTLLWSCRYYVMSIVRPCMF
jgi:hypothetical protein